MQAQPAVSDDIAKAISQAQYCHQHKKSKELFCTKCVNLMCIVCFVNCGHSADIISDENLKDEVQSGIESLSNINQKEEQICEQIDKSTQVLKDYLKKLEQTYVDEAEKLKSEVRMKYKAFKIPQDFSVDNLDQCIDLYKSLKMVKEEPKKGISFECLLQPDFEKVFPSYEKLMKLDIADNSNPEKGPVFDLAQFNSRSFAFGENKKSVVHQFDGFHSAFAKDPLPRSSPFSFKVKIENPKATLIGVAPASCLQQSHSYSKQGACLLNNNCGAVYKNGSYNSTGKSKFESGAVVRVSGDLRVGKIIFEVNGVEYYTGELTMKLPQTEDYYPVVDMGYVNECAIFLDE